MSTTLEEQIAGLQERVAALELVVHAKGASPVHHASTRSDKYSGPQGGIQRLSDEGFFGSPRDLASVKKQMEESGYVYPRQSINNALSRLSKPGGPLVMVKRDGKKTYAKRK